MISKGPADAHHSAAEGAGADGGNEALGAGAVDPVAARMSGARAFSCGADEGESSGLAADEQLADEIITQALGGDSAAAPPRSGSRILG